MPACNVKPATPPCVWSRRLSCRLVVFGSSLFLHLGVEALTAMFLTWQTTEVQSLAQWRLTPQHWHSLPVFTRVCGRAHNAAGAVCKVHKRDVPTAGGQKSGEVASQGLYSIWEGIWTWYFRMSASSTLFLHCWEAELWRKELLCEWAGLVVLAEGFPNTLGWLTQWIKWL